MGMSRGGLDSSPSEFNHPVLAVATYELSPGRDMGAVSLLAIGVQREGQASDSTLEEVAGWFREQRRRGEPDGCGLNWESC